MGSAIKIEVELPDDTDFKAYRHVYRSFSPQEILALIRMFSTGKYRVRQNADIRKYIYISPKSKEGCRVSERQARKLNKLALYRKTNLRTYCMLKRLILLNP